MWACPGPGWRPVGGAVLAWPGQCASEGGGRGFAGLSMVTDANVFKRMFAWSSPREQYPMHRRKHEEPLQNILQG